MIKFNNPGQETAKRVIEKFEKDKKVTLPKDYALFILKHNRAEPENNSFKGKGHIEVRRFLSFPDETIKRLKEVKDRIPKNTLPIAEDSCDNLILISSKNGSIYFWDHEIDDISEREKNTSKPKRIANSFTEFFKKLERFDTNSPKNGKAEVVYTSPDFREKFKDFLKK